MTVTIRDDQKEYMKKHKELNLSGLLQKCLDKWIETHAEEEQ